MQSLNRKKETPSQTSGPYVQIGCAPNASGIRGVYQEDFGRNLFGEGVKGERITIRGCVWDGLGAPVRDAMIEIWQADSKGVYPDGDAKASGADPNFFGWGRTSSDLETGEWSFETIKPGRVAFPDGKPMAPHVSFWIAARGINIGLHTRMYFPDEESANAEDPWLLGIEPRARRETLIAEKIGEGEYRFDIRLQGDSEGAGAEDTSVETVFFDV